MSRDRDRDRNNDKDMQSDSSESRSVFSRRKARPAEDLVIDYKDVDTLRPFLSEGGRIVPARVSRLSCKQQRKLTTEVKRARQLALVPMSDSHRGGNGY